MDYKNSDCFQTCFPNTVALYCDVITVMWKLMLLVEPVLYILVLYINQSIYQ